MNRAILRCVKTWSQLVARKLVLARGVSRPAKKRAKRPAKRARRQRLAADPVKQARAEQPAPVRQSMELATITETVGRMPAHEQVAVIGAVMAAQVQWAS